MAGVSVKMGVDASQFKQGIDQARSAVKTLDAELKLNEKQLKATGDAETYAANKSRLLNRQLDEQNKVVQGVQKQLEEMKKNGVDETSEAYQKLERSLYGAAGKMMEIQAELNSLTGSEQKAAKGANEMADNLASINKKVSFDAVITGVGKITSGIENAIKGAINLGETLFDEFKDAAKWADDTATMAQMYEIPLEKFLQMQALVGNGMDTSVDAMLGGMQRIKKTVGRESKETMDTLKSLGLVVTQTVDDGFGKIETTKKMYGNADDLFWKAGQAIMNMGDAFDKEAAAQALFGKSWRELVPLFSTYRSAEEYSKALEDVTTNSTDAVEALAESSDALSGLETSWQTLKYETLGALAPAISEAAGVLQQLLDSVTEYLKTDAGQELLKNMGDAVGALFEDLSKIDPESVVQNFVAVFDQLKDAFLWIKENWNAVKIGLEGIVGVWAVGKVINGANTILSMINGIKGLTAAEAAASGAVAGESWGAAFAAKVVAAAPWLIGIYTALNPADTGDNTVYDETTGNLTGEGMANYQMDAKRYLQYGELNDWGKTLLEIGDMFGEMSIIMNDVNAVNAMNRYRVSGRENIDQLLTEMAALGYTPYSDWATTRERSKQFIAEQEGGTAAESAAADEAAKKITDMGSSSDDTSGFIRILGEETDTATGHVTKFGELAGGAEGSVQDLGNAAAAAAAALASIQAPSMVPSFLSWAFGSHANGLWDVPWDGYPAILHKGERVIPAREMGSRSYNSNLYVESMYMNNGQDADALAASMAAAQRRTMSGYGS